MASLAIIATDFMDCQGCEKVLYLTLSCWQSEKFSDKTSLEIFLTL
jgi:hypothetical protein